MITLVVKVTGDARGGLHGTASRVAGGETRTFAGAAQLIELIEEWVAGEGPRPLEEVAAPGPPAAAPTAPQSGRNAARGRSARAPRPARGGALAPGQAGRGSGARARGRSDLHAHGQDNL